MIGSTTGGAGRMKAHEILRDSRCLPAHPYAAPGAYRRADPSGRRYRSLLNYNTPAVRLGLSDLPSALAGAASRAAIRIRRAEPDLAVRDALPFQKTDSLATERIHP